MFKFKIGDILIRVQERGSKNPDLFRVATYSGDSYVFHVVSSDKEAKYTGYIEKSIAEHHLVFLIRNDLEYEELEDLYV